jgi:hypothetical protein
MRHAPAALLVTLLSVMAAGAPEPPQIRGVVLDPAGRPLAGATVTLRAPGNCCIVAPGEGNRTAVTDAQGRFALEAPETPMVLRATHADGAPVSETAADGAILRLGAPRHLDAFVPVDAELYVTHGLERLATARGAGEVRLGPLPDGEPVTLHVVSPRHRPYQQRIVMGEAGGNPQVVLDEGLALRGTVSPPRAGVVLRASQGEARESVAESDAAGAFALTGLRKGEVMVVVLDGEAEPQVLLSEAGGRLAVELGR